MIKTLEAYSKKYISLGIDDTTSEKEELKITLINQIALAALTVNVFIFMFYFLSQQWAFTGIVTIVFILESIPLILNHLKKYQLARLYFLSFGAILIFAIKCTMGRDINGDLAFLVLTLMAYILFDRKKYRLWYCLGIIALYIISQYVNTHYEPLLTIRQTDVYVMFVGCMICTILIISIYLKVMTGYQIGKHQLLQEIKAKNESLRDKNEDLERFAYIASHDMKTPLRTVISFLGLMEKKLKTKQYEQIPEYLNFAKSGAKQMHFLVSDILEYSKVKEAPGNKQLVDLDSILTQVKFNLQKIIEDKKVIIEAEPLPEFYCSDVQMILIFQNLVENAIKYNESAQPKISIKSRKLADAFELEFMDNGIGIEATYHDAVFEMFKRLHTTDQYQGTGIGLAVCKKIVEQYNGTIQIENNEWEGTTFVLRFPVEVVEAVGDLTLA